MHQIELNWERFDAATLPWGCTNLCRSRVIWFWTGICVFRNWGAGGGPQLLSNGGGNPITPLPKTKGRGTMSLGSEVAHGVGAAD